MTVTLTTRAVKGSALTHEELDDNWDELQSKVEALQTEIEAARGDRSELGLRIETISNFASPNVGGVFVGNYYDNAFQGTNSATLAGGTGRFELVPFYTSSPLRIDRIGVAVSTAHASLAKCGIYTSGEDFWPDTPVLEPVDTLDCSTTGFKEHTVDFTFDAGRSYWLAVHRQSTSTIRAVNASSAPNLGLATSAATTYNTFIRRTVTWGSSFPSPFNLIETEMVNGSSPSIRFRAAALS